MSSKYSNQRVAGKEHIPLYPKGFIAVRIIQLVGAVICLALCGYSITYAPLSGVALMIFTAVATLIASVYCLVAHYGPPGAFNYWAILALDIFLIIFWLCSFAVVAAIVGAGFVAYDLDYYGFEYYDTYTAASFTYGICLIVAAALGGIEFVLYIVSLSIHGVMLHRHRKAGLKCMPGHTTSAAAPIGGAAGSEKFQMETQTQPQNPPTGSPLEEQMYAAPPRQQQSFYPQQSPAPMYAQPTGNSYVQPQPMNPNKSVYEVPSQPQPTHSHPV